MGGDVLASARAAGVQFSGSAVLAHRVSVDAVVDACRFAALVAGLDAVRIACRAPAADGADGCAECGDAQFAAAHADLLPFLVVAAGADTDLVLPVGQFPIVVAATTATHSPYSGMFGGEQIEKFPPGSRTGRIARCEGVGMLVQVGEQKPGVRR
ncbi:hypothetical protein JXX30_00355 [Rhodococcus erythropolis]|uniref:hypothetical protein n=1 Tax=Rhodococcus erythropolis TaxID=1833 RepID=UPI001981B8CD|nr:hypothetical protein [Rhodococcus erythropolis]QSE41327.1 hypothetical protein JXX30_00355 [Rhodococcus erythropolis]